MIHQAIIHIRFFKPMHLLEQPFVATLVTPLVTGPFVTHRVFSTGAISESTGNYIDALQLNSILNPKPLQISILHSTIDLYFHRS